MASFSFLTWFKFVSLFIWEKWPLAFPFCFVYAKHVIVIHQSQTSMKSPEALLASNWKLLQFLSIADWMNWIWNLIKVPTFQTIRFLSTQDCDCRHTTSPGFLPSLTLSSFTVVTYGTFYGLLVILVSLWYDLYNVLWHPMSPDVIWRSPISYDDV